MSAATERRTSARVDSASRILHREFMLGPDKPGFSEDTLSDISPRDLAFTTKAKYEADTLLETKLMLIGWDKFKLDYYMGDPRRAAAPLVVIARVANVRPQTGGIYRVAATFESVDESHREALAKYLAALPGKRP